MSHFTTYRTALKNLTEAAVRDAVADLAKQLGATVITHMNSYYWDRQNILIGLVTKDLPNGIGVRVENGQLLIVGDPYGQKLAYERMQKLIPSYVKIHKVKLQAKNARLATKTTIREREVELVVNY